MKILVVGSGGREHALAWKFSEETKVDKIFVAPGNAGTEQMEKTENINLNTAEDILKFAVKEKIDLTIVGSEELLVSGIVDAFEAKGLKIFGPNKKAAVLEGSKSYSKDFMKKYGIKTARYENFNNYEEAIVYLENQSFPIVIKASGLAAGKGVVICASLEEAKEAVNDIMNDKVFGTAGAEVVIEEFLTGVEASILSVTDSNVILPFISAKDHKKIGEGETGLNTGGMGVVAPNPYVTEEVMEEFNNHILKPTLEGIKAEGMDFNGVIFFGLMITKDGVYSLEYNMRMGDPETQAVLPLLKTSFLDVIIATMNKNLDTVELEWEEKSSCCVVAASGGYPLSYEKNKEVNGIEEITESQVFLAGVKLEENKYLTSGGRVLNVVAKEENLDDAIRSAYKSMERINFNGKYIRNDIGK